MRKNALEWVVAGLVFAAFAASGWSRQPLTLEERVKAQEAIERVYYNHRIWPKENPAPKPPFEQMVTRAMLEAKVTDYLKKSAALGEFWQRPITGEQLQAEMDRMAKGTRDPAALKELFSALNNDPYLVAECLARPILADRLIRNWYACDERFHKEKKALAETVRASAESGDWCSVSEGTFRRVTFVLEEGARLDESGIQKPDDETRWLSKEKFRKMVRRCPEPGELPILEETPEAFVVTRTIRHTSRTLEVEILSLSKRDVQDWLSGALNDIEASSALSDAYEYILPSIEVGSADCSGSWADSGLSYVPDGRTNHTAVWTGAEMIIWGGSGYNTGGRYNPSTDAWTPTSYGMNCPAGRTNHSAIWTGTEMIVWGGYSNTNYLNTGGRYNPLTDQWAPTSMGVNVPSARCFQTAVWTGTEMIVWGGDYYSSYLDTGGRYNPSKDAWTPTSTGTGCPSAREYHTAVWTGSVMIVWGGYYPANDTGGVYDPATDTWKPTTTGGGCPSARYQHTAIWTGTEMIVWGGMSIGLTKTGGRYNPSSDTWTTTFTGTNCPDERYRQTAIWTGTEMIVWGGITLYSGFPSNSGGKYNPAIDTWIATSAAENTPAGREYHTAIWTGHEMIVWGGYWQGSQSPYFLYENTGGRYDPSTDSWVPTAATNAPAPRYSHTAIWTGAEMIVWGGEDPDRSGGFNTGGRFNPATATWTSTSTSANVPSGRFAHTAVWTGTDMIIWGGSYSENTGGRYNPVSDIWLPTSTGTNVPSGRQDHTAVWTGTEMIVWGGAAGGFPMFNTNFTSNIEY